MQQIAFLPIAIVGVCECLHVYALLMDHTPTQFLLSFKTVAGIKLQKYFNNEISPSKT